MSYLCEEGQGVVGALGSHLSDQIFGAVLQKLLLYGVPALQPGKEGENELGFPCAPDRTRCGTDWT